MSLAVTKKNHLTLQFPFLASFSSVSLINILNIRHVSPFPFLGVNMDRCYLLLQYSTDLQYSNLIMYPLLKSFEFAT